MAPRSDAAQEEALAMAFVAVGWNTASRGPAIREGGAAAEGPAPRQLRRAGPAAASVLVLTNPVAGGGPLVCRSDHLWRGQAILWPPREYKL